MEEKKKTPFENIIANSKSLSDLSGELCGKFNWFAPQEIKEPFEGAVALATLPVKVVYKEVENMVIEILEDGTEVLYTGFIMELLPDTFLARDYKHDRIIGQLNLSA